MDTNQIAFDMMNNKFTKKYFRGVFPADSLPNKVKKPALIIANTDESSKPGQHWVAFYLPKKGALEYFDSIGEQPKKNYFLKFLKKNGTCYWYNAKRLQGSFSTTCGNYCVMFLLHRVQKISKKKFLNLFSSNYDLNDQNILKMYKKVFKSKEKQFGANSIICNQICQPSS